MAIDTEVSEAIKNMKSEIMAEIQKAVTVKKSGEEGEDLKKRAEQAEEQQSGLIRLINSLNDTQIGRYAQRSSMMSWWTLIVFAVGYLVCYFSLERFDLVAWVKTFLYLN